jgi:hypothetical protein
MPEGVPASQGPDGTWYDDQGNPTAPPPGQSQTPPPRTGPPAPRVGGTTGSGGTPTAGNVGQPISPDGSGGPTIAPFGTAPPPVFSAPTLPASLQTPFTLPTGQDLISNDPGYMARYQQGLDAQQRGAAAQGTLLSGGQLKAAAQYGQDYATNEYQNYVNNQLQQRQQQASDYLNLQYGPAWGQNQSAVNQYGQLYGQYKDLVANNLTANNDYMQYLLGQEQVGAAATGAPPTSATSNV